MLFRSGGANRLEGRVEGHRFVCGTHVFELPAGVTAPEGPSTLAVRAEELVLGGTGPSLNLLARLFLGSSTEYRFAIGDSVLRVVGPARDAKPGEAVAVSLQHARLYPR